MLYTVDLVLVAANHSRGGESSLHNGVAGDGWKRLSVMTSTNGKTTVE